MRITLTIRKRFEEQAAERFDAAKKAKRKLAGALATIARYQREAPAVAPKIVAESRTKAWYERFRWTYASAGSSRVLIVGGRDAGTNEVLLKRHVEPTDRIIHTEEPGSPFVLVKGATNLPQEQADTASLVAGQVCAAYSRAWKRSIATTEVFWVSAEQVSKTANSGEFISKGAFMVRGEKRHFSVPVSISLGRIDSVPACGVAAEFQGIYATLAPGEEKSSDIAKKLVKRLGGTPDDWLPLIPPGGAIVRGWHRGELRETDAPDGDRVASPASDE